MVLFVWSFAHYQTLDIQYLNQRSGHPPVAKFGQKFHLSSDHYLAQHWRVKCRGNCVSWSMASILCNTRQWIVKIINELQASMSYRHRLISNYTQSRIFISDQSIGPNIPSYGAKNSIFKEILVHAKEGPRYHVCTPKNSDNSDDFLFFPQKIKIPRPGGE